MRVDRLRETYDIAVRYVQFPLHPETPEEGFTLDELFAGRQIDVPAANRRMERLMADERLPYGDRTMTFNSRLAQELAKWAETQPNGELIHDTLFRAYFVDGTNLARIENLVEIAVKVGLPGETVRDVLTRRTMRAAVDDDWRRSRDLGVTGVPTFVIGNRSLVGAQPYEMLERLVIDSGGTVRSSETTTPKLRRPGH